MAVLGILGVVGSCFGPAIEIGKLIAASVRHQCSYLCCLGSNIKTLEDEAKILDIATKDLQERVDADTNNAQIILSMVDTWLKDSVKVKTETKEIVDEAPDVGSGCSKLGKRYSLSKKAKKAAIAIKLLVKECKFTEISHPPPTAASAPVQSGTTTYEFESRRGIEEEIVKGLGDKNVNKIGICGMGGLGKTTMAKKIMNRALKKGLFGEVVIAVVSKPVDKLNIQLQIGEQLGVKFEDETLIPRANILRKRLRGAKKTLLVLDDVWERLDMVELGIPCEDGCKVLITSRVNNVFIEMGFKKVEELNILDEEEAWLLFRGNAGTCVEDSVLKSTAKDVMRECNGLPLALEIVGLALKDKTDISKWEDALGQLRRSNPKDTPSIIEKVYNHLKLSYDHLDSENTKTMFLLCCLFPEDCEISMEHLSYFAVGLHVFEDLGDLKEVIGRTRSLIDILKSRGLLLDGSYKYRVRMHDVVRDVSIFIASTERRIKCEDCTWISSHVHGRPRLNNVPKLKLLLMNDKAEEEQEMDNLIEGSTELNVLFIERYGLLKSLPVTVSLTALVLSNCESLESIAVVGELVSLEILICRHCGLIEELLEQAKGLKRLKLLEIAECPKLRRVAAGKSVLSTAKDFFLQLETIVIRRCYEMEHLLVTVPNEEEQDDECGITLSFPKLKELVLINVPKLRSMICGRGIESIQFPLLVELRIGFCSSWIKWLGSGEDDDDDHYKDDQSLHLFCLTKVSFDKLQILSLGGNTKIKNVWCDKVPMDFFTGLVELKLVYYTKTRRLFSSSSKIPQNLVNLQKLAIGRCKEMVKVIEDEEEASDDDTTKHNTTPLFPSLQEINLWDLPKLESFCEQRCALELPSLKIIYINRCDEMKSFNAVTPALQAISINGEELESGDDLNAVLLHQQYLRKAKKERGEEEENEIIPC